MSAPSALTVIGLGADGWPGVPARLRELVLDAEVVFGGGRQLGLLPPGSAQERVAWPSGLRDALPGLLASYDGKRVVVLASGDPLVSGIGSTLISLLGPDAVRIEPAVSSVALAAARMNWPSELVTVISVVGRDPRTVVRELAPGRRLLVLSSGAQTPGEVAELLVAAGFGDSSLTALGDLGAPEESRLSGNAADWATTPPDVSPLHVLAVDLPAVPAAWRSAWVAGLADDAFEHDGQLTKRDLRASALARLAPAPGQLLWDVGAGAGSVAIEWSRAHPTCRAVAIEADPTRADRIARNAGGLGVPSVEVMLGRAPDALADLPAPHAVFVGGGATRPGVLDRCLDALAPGGRLVVHGVTVETEAELARRYAALGGELTRIAVEHAAPVGTFTGWTPARTVTQWAYLQAP